MILGDVDDGSLEIDSGSVLSPLAFSCGIVEEDSVIRNVFQGILDDISMIESATGSSNIYSLHSFLEYIIFIQKLL